LALHPGVGQGLRCGEALLRVHAQQPADEVLGLVRDGVPVLCVKLEHPCLDLPEEQLLVVIVEGGVATQ